MNKVILLGRLTRDAEVRYSNGNEPMAIARYTLAVDRRRAQDGQQSADFISCVSFGKAGEFMEKYGKKGQKFCIEGRIQTGSNRITRMEMSGLCTNHTTYFRASYNGKAE